MPGSCPEGVKEFPSKVALKDEVISLAEVLKPAGYITARFGKWHVGGSEQGFDISSGGGNDKARSNHYGSTTVAETLTDATIDFVKKNKERPFFVYLSHWDVHGPIRAKDSLLEKYTAKNEKLGTSFNPAYAGMVEQVDRSLARVRKAVEDMGLAEKTLIIFTSDNGGAHYTSNKPLKSAKGALHEGGIRVSGVAYWKGKTLPGSVSKTVITSVDMLPTFAEGGGAKLPESQPVDGVSVLSAMKGEPKAELKERAVYRHYPHYLEGTKGKSRVIPPFGETEGYFRGTPSSAIRKGPWKLIYFIETHEGELYNIEKDPYETTDLREIYPEKYAELKAEVKAWQKETNAPVPSKINPLFGKPDAVKAAQKPKNKGKKNGKVKEKDALK